MSTYSYSNYSPVGKNTFKVNIKDPCAMSTLSQQERNYSDVPDVTAIRLLLT